jgi:DHA2 family multidrug resistance protein
MDEDKNGKLKWLILATVIMGTFLGRLDGTVVNLAVPKIISAFGVTVSTAGWIATAYILANAVFVPIWGKLGDTIGRKKVYITGFVLFIISSILAGFAWNFASLIIFRVIQAIAVSADYPTAMAILATTFPSGRPRAQALGIWSSVFGAAAVFGPLLGGPLIDAFGWRSVFFLNLPVGLIGLLMAFKFIPESVSDRKTVSFDWWGALTLGVALSGMVLVLDKGLDWGWFSGYSMLCYIATVVSFGLFYAIEHNHPEPIVDLKFFKNAVFVNTLTNNFISFMGIMGSTFLIPVFAQTFLGYNATQAGYLFIPMAVGLLVAAPFGAALVGRVKPNYVIFASTLVGGIGIFMLTGLDPRSTALDIMIPMAIMAAGLGFGMAQRTSIITTVVPESEMGMASGVLALVRNISGAFGVALFATVLNYSIKSNVLSIAANSFVTNPALRGTVTELIILKAQVEGYDTVFLVASILIFIGAISALFLKTGNERSTGPVFVEA